MRNSIGIMLVTGMVIGTLFTLFVVPSISMLVARTRKAEEQATADLPAGAEPVPARSIDPRGPAAYRAADGRRVYFQSWGKVPADSHAPEPLPSRLEPVDRE